MKTNFHKTNLGIRDDLGMAYNSLCIKKSTIKNFGQNFSQAAHMNGGQSLHAISMVATVGACDSSDKAIVRAFERQPKSREKKIMHSGPRRKKPSKPCYS